MPRNDHHDSQEPLFRDDTGERETNKNDDGTADKGLDEVDYSFEGVALPAVEPREEEGRDDRRSSTLLIMGAVIVVLTLTTLLSFFFGGRKTDQTTAAGSEDSAETAASPADQRDSEEAGRTSIETKSSSQANRVTDSNAIFEAHAELQGKYVTAEKQIAELESELQTLRAQQGSSPADPEANKSRSGPPNEGLSTAEKEELGRLKIEIAALREDMEKSRKDHDTAVKLLESNLADARRQTEREQKQLSDTRRQVALLEEETQQLKTDNERLENGGTVLEDQVAALTEQLADREDAYDRLFNETHSRRQGESDAVQELLNRHAEELASERETRTEQAREIERLNKVIASLSVTPNDDRGAPNGTRQTSTSGATSADGSPATREIASTAASEETPPQVISKQEPDYPVMARRLRVEGTVVLRVLVDERGDVVDTRIVRSPAGGKMLETAAQEAVRNWKFSPGRRDNEAVRMWHEIPITFKL